MQELIAWAPAGFISGRVQTQRLAVCYLSQERWGRVCEYMHARAIYNVLTQGKTVQKGGSNPNPRQITPWRLVKG